MKRLHFFIAEKTNSEKKVEISNKPARSMLKIQ